MEQQLRSVDVECLPGEIVGEFTLDVSNLAIGDNLCVRDIKVDPSKLTILTSPEITVVSVQLPHVEEEKPAEEAAAVEGAVEGQPPAEGAEAAPGAPAEAGKEGKEGKEPGKVRIVLSNASITNADGAAIDVRAADEVAAGDHAPRADPPDDHGLTAQRGLVALLDGREERVQVEVQDPPGHDTRG